ncbi:MAG: tetratricopeptide repeat protein [Flavobacteriaceae bacterium]|nr:tetratricopeptide repeat protein [Flavobacteriaceae bacterium]
MRTLHWALAIFLLPFGMQAQAIDSSKVTKIEYNYLKGSKTKVLVTPQQQKAQAAYRSGYAYVNQNKYQAAISPFMTAIKIDSTGNCGTGRNGMAHSELAYVHTRLGAYDKGLAYADKALALNDSIPEPYLTKAVIFQQRKEFKKALQVLDTLVVRVPRYAMGFAQRGLLLDYIGQDEKAVSDYKESIRLFKEQGLNDNPSNSLIKTLQLKIENIEGQE